MLFWTTSKTMTLLLGTSKLARHRIIQLKLTLLKNYGMITGQYLKANKKQDLLTSLFCKNFNIKLIN